jgi:membrane protease YdiL (CAAX protease family)
LLRRLLVWRVGIGWYVVALFGIAVLILLALMLYTLLGGMPLLWPPLPFGPILSVLLLFVVSLLINGEELGWRGYALPRLQGKYSALTASLILGVIWSLFHLPLFLTHGGGVGGNLASEPPLGFPLRTVADAVLVTWVFNNTQGSVLLVILFHAAVNTWTQVLPGIDTAHYPAGLLYWVFVGLICLATVIVVVVFGPARLSRKPAKALVYVTDQVRNDDPGLHGPA